MSENKEYDIYRIALDEYTTYNICVPKDQLKEFKKWRESRDVNIFEHIGKTEDECKCFTIFDHGHEFIPWCDDLLEEE